MPPTALTGRLQLVLPHLGLVDAASQLKRVAEGCWGGGGSDRADMEGNLKLRAPNKVLPSQTGKGRVPKVPKNIPLPSMG